MSIVPKEEINMEHLVIVWRTSPLYHDHVLTLCFLRGPYQLQWVNNAKTARTQTV
jgi:hypothetical protein